MHGTTVNPAAILLIPAGCGGDRKGGVEIGWGRSLPKGRGLGIAGHYSFVTYVAVAVEVEVNGKGELIIPRVDIAVDCGPHVNPERIRAQMEARSLWGRALQC